MKHYFMSNITDCFCIKKLFKVIFLSMYRFIENLTFIKKVLIVLFLFLIFFASTPVYSSSYNEDEFILLNENWQYHIGDSLTGSNDLPLLIQDDNFEWTDVEISTYIERPDDCDVAWLRIKIPDADWISPAIYFEEIYGESISMYINERLILDTGDSYLRSDKNSFVVPFISEDYGQYLYIRIALNRYHRFGPIHNVYMGDYQHLSLLFTRKGHSSEILGFCLIFLGVVLLITAFLIAGSNKKIVISLCPVLICMGLIYIVHFSRFVARFPEYDWILNGLFSSLILASLFSITYFFKQIFGSGYRKIIDICLKLTLIIFFIMLLHNALDNFSLGYHAYVYILGGWSLINISILLISASYNSYKGNTDAKIFMLGFCIFALILITEMFVFLFYSNNYRFSVFKWGILAFILSHIIILGRKITSFHNKTILYSKELEQKNTQLDLMWNEVKESRDNLAELNRTLEDKVIERTHQLQEANEELVLLNEELHASNVELNDTLEMLKNTQDQLIKSEKMAALGQLVSGIAHELNTPLAAIQASVNNITEYTQTIFSLFFDFLEDITTEKIQMFLCLLKNSKNNSNYISTRDERKQKRALLKELNQLEIKNARRLAEQLTALGILDYKPYIKILENPKLHVIIEIVYLIVSLKNSSYTLSLAAEKTTKVVFALKSYSHQGNLNKNEETDIIESIETVLTIYNNKIKSGVEVVKNYTPLPKIKSNVDELTQVWTNIIHNALQAMNYNGTLSIDTYIQNKYIVVSITDSGSGIPDDIRDKIFQPFFTTKPLGEGTGLGLDIVSKIIKNHYGKIEVSSKPGKTTFSVFIPMQENINSEITDGSI
ncbi:ATP-binding protein [Herbivorax sp. ANBcel31]|uniref:ATP-binding protein n=1 Tax=Herbivorax sp. ANBcel31 TaxID=3069754 RepID=UPI0027B66565|nr:ATP-binding protein [Herbivorax sp. ANBcel31]MDQ2084846.1 ATP-binding protein [Herbivorax sp. ANBcel31]